MAALRLVARAGFIIMILVMLWPYRWVLGIDLDSTLLQISTFGFFTLAWILFRLIHASSGLSDPGVYGSNVRSIDGGVVARDIGIAILELVLFAGVAGLIKEFEPYRVSALRDIMLNAGSVILVGGLACVLALVLMSPHEDRLGTSHRS